MRLGLRDVAHFEIEEGESLERAGMVRRDPHGHVPFVERARIVVLVGQDARVQIVRVREVRMPLESVHGDAQRRLELAFAPQRFAEPQEDEALRILRELRG